MSLRLNRNVPITDYVLQIDNSVTWSWRAALSYRPASRWVDRTGVYQVQGVRDDNLQWGLFRIDPELIDTTSSRVGFINTGLNGYFLGDYEPLTGNQRLFGKIPGSGTGINFTEVVTDDPLQVIGSVFPNTWVDFPNPAGGITSNLDIGYWEVQTAQDADVLFFPGINRMLVLWAFNVRFSDNNLHSGVMAWVDLTTGAATILDSPINYRTAGQTDQFNRGALFGETENVTFKSGQFIPDDDSLNSAPKGRLMLTAGRVPSGGGGGAKRSYVKFIEFNPTGAGGSPQREHLREIIITRVETDWSGVPSSLLPDPANNTVLGQYNSGQFLYFDTRRNRVMMATSQTQGWTTDPRANALCEWDLTPDITNMTPPTPLGPPSTGRVVLFQTDLRGSLNERVGGEVVNWSLERTSTEGEQIDVSGSSPGDLIAVANQPVDLLIDYNRRVLKNGTPLTEGVEYTWTTTGVQFIGPEPDAGAIYLVDYPHPATPVPNPHGVLLNSTSISLEDGRAQARVRLADDDNLVGGRDKITATTD